jgi:ABC-type oligopeptide transport system substrate-binding subunit
MALSRRKRLLPTIAILLGIALLAGCAGRPPQIVAVTVPVTVVQTRVVETTREAAKTVVVTATPVPTPAYVSRLSAPADTLVYPLAAEPVALDPLAADDEAAGLALAQLYEGLFRLGADGGLLPAAAAGYATSADGLTYTITLRSGLRWSDGAALTAQHFAVGICRGLAPAAGSGYAHLLTTVAPVRGAAAFASGAAADCRQVGVRPLDDLRLEIALARPAPFLPRLLALPVSWPARLDLTGDRRPATGVTSTPPSTVVGLPSAITNGPYLLTEYKPGERILLTRNPAYWNAAQVAIGRIEFRIISDPAAQWAAYDAGQLHVAHPPAGELARLLAGPAGRELRFVPQPGVSFIGLNTQLGPTQNPAFRKAVASAIDRERLLRDALGQPWRPAAVGLLPWAGDQAGGLRYDPAAARRYLAEAGYDPASPPPPVELWFNREGGNTALFAALAEMLEASGIPVKLVGSRWEAYAAALAACEPASPSRLPATCSYGLYRLGWVEEYPDPAALLESSPGRQSPLGPTGWTSGAYAGLLAEARRTVDQARRTALYRQAETLLLDEAVVVPLWYYDRPTLVKPGVQPIFPPFGPPDLAAWRVPAP